MKLTRDDVTPIQGPLLHNGISFNYKIGSFNSIPQILAEIINDLTIKAYFDPSITNTVIFKYFPDGNVNHFCLW